MKILANVVLMLFVVLLVACGGGGGGGGGGTSGGSAPATPAPVADTNPITVIPSTVTATTDGQFSIQLSVTGVQNVDSVTSHIRFDPSLVTYVGATQGDFFLNSCPTSLLSSVSPNLGEEGTVIFGITTLGSCNVSSSGTIVAFTFKVISPQTTSISFSESSLFQNWLENTLILPPVQVAIK